MRLRWPRTPFRLLLVLAAWLAVAPLPAAAQAIVAVVNDDVVTDLQVEQRVLLALFASNQRPTAEAAERLWQPVLRTLIDERLQVQEARRLGIEVTSADIDAAVRDVAQRNNVSVEVMLADLARGGVKEETFRDQLRAQLAWVQVARRQLLRRAIVTDVQIDQTLERLTAGGAQYRLAEVFLPIDSEANAPRVLQDAERLREAVRRGADFAGLAQQFSASPSAERGGDLGWIPAENLPPELLNIIAGLADGEVSAPLRTPDGVYLFRRLSQRTAGERIEADAAMREQVVQRLREDAMERLAARYLRNLRQEAFIDLRL
ncbi:MAG: peptidylprolyl isomerase [Geminicoccaceae bacterium]|nr:MAG: peptidylprolyl isomerase [Geminicoccaceae bacterium]